MKTVKKIKAILPSSVTMKRTFCTLALSAMTLAMNAQAAGGIIKATQEFQKYFDPVQKLLYALAAIIALIGGFSVFTKMQNGDQDVKKTILMVVGGCVALIAFAQAIPAFFKI